FILILKPKNCATCRLAHWGRTSKASPLCFRARVTAQRMVGRRSDWWLISTENVALFSCRGGNARHRTGCTPRRHRLRLGQCVNLVREKASFPVRFLTRRLICNE